jgi:shikimate dehydrogenase
VKAAVLGDPIDHSLSPVLHRTAYATLGLDWSYDAVRVPAGGLREFVEGLDAEWRGLSLTMPLKREALSLLDSRDEWVALTGAANTVVLERDGSRHGLNTDVTGALMCFNELQATPERAVVLGGGATATSVLMALAELGLREAVLVVRDPERAAKTVAAVAGHRRPPALRVQTFDAVSADVLGADVLVSTIPASAQLPELVSTFGDVPLVFEVVYSPWPTPLAAAAWRRGQPLISGLDLLVAQALNQVIAMTGRFDVPAGAMREAAERVLAERGSA